MPLTVPSIGPSGILNFSGEVVLLSGQTHQLDAGDGKGEGDRTCSHHCGNHRIDLNRRHWNGFSPETHEGHSTRRYQHRPGSSLGCCPTLAAARMADVPTERSKK